ncbi:MAG: response regulator [Magnetococcales bacterium]|nr:response regulator [Magnetococcales bacterium]MBF0114221.1 response regulator [Magnetococcales bacterium]
MITVLIVNDSATDRAVLRSLLRRDPGIILVGEAVNGEEAIDKVMSHDPDVVLMDLLLPGLDGVETIRRLMASHPCRILVVTALMKRNAGMIFKALSLGALDYIETPTLPVYNSDPAAFQASHAEGLRLLEKIHRLHRFGRDGLLALVNDLQVVHSSRERRLAARVEEKRLQGMVVIGSSTGGPSSLAILANALAKPLPLPVVICQHIDQEFTSGLADWLSQETGVPVTIIDRSLFPEAGRFYLAQGGKNTVLTGNGCLTVEVPSNKDYFIPSINRFFASVAAVLGESACGVILTGMGSDGAEGLAAIQKAGGTVLVQAAQEAIVASMPEAALAACPMAQGGSLEQLAKQVRQWMIRTARRQRA